MQNISALWGTRQRGWCEESCDERCYSEGLARNLSSARFHRGYKEQSGVVSFWPFSCIERICMSRTFRAQDHPWCELAMESVPLGDWSAMSWLLALGLAICAGPSSWWEGDLPEQATVFCCLSDSSQNSVWCSQILWIMVVDLRWELMSHRSGPCLYMVTSISVCQAGLALSLALPVWRFLSEVPSGHRHTKDMSTRSSFPPSVHCHLPIDNRQLPNHF